METAGEEPLAKPGYEPGEAGLRSVLWAGALYFLALGAIELSGFYLRTVPRRAHRIHMSLRRG